MKVLTQKKNHDHVPCSFAYKIVCIDDGFSKPTVVYRGENAAYEFIEAVRKEYQYRKKSNEKTFQQKFSHEQRRRTFSSTQ